MAGGLDDSLDENLLSSDDPGRNLEDDSGPGKNLENMDEGKRAENGDKSEDSHDSDDASVKGNGDDSTAGKNESSEQSFVEEESESDKSPLIDFCLQVCKEEKRALLQEKLNELGAETLSDLKHVDMKEEFKGILKPVQISKLIEKYKEIGASAPKTIEQGLELFDFEKILTKHQRDLLKGDQRLLHHEVIDITKEIGDHMYLNLGKPRLSLCKRLGQLLLTKYRKALEGSKLSKGLTAISLSNQIRNRVRYCQRKERKRKATKNRASAPLQLNEFSKRQCHGIQEDRDLPVNFPSGETAEDQEVKRLQLSSMSKTGEVNWKTVKQLMAETYVAQRLTINTLNRMDLILKEWPYIGKFNILKAHFYHLMDLDVSLEASWNDLFPKIVKFLTAEANRKFSPMNMQGPTAESCKTIRGVLKKFEKCEEKTCELEFVVVILGLIAKWNMSTSNLLVHFPDTASYDEVQASRSLPKDGKPIVAVLGDDLFQSPECFVLVDNRIISPITVGPIKAITAAFMSYYVFKITYPRNLQPLLNFFERDLFHIETSESSSRTERKKKPDGSWEGTPKPLSSKYIRLMKQIDEFLDMW
ncbi:uncharacterized protein LOC117652660 [Thrips palmi]|uniref:Uncharacterized protein LOC117652660 n=1 Tax=Thrips palmi TaxID=161013 RepID=A0A6P9A8N5_THRPL|nr:uncharacterized protein LOC117652660 [Thrips palmi]